MQFFFPLIIIIACYTFILKKLFKRKNRKDETDFDSSARSTIKSTRKHKSISETEIENLREKLQCRQHGNTAKFSKSKIKTIKLTLTVIILYICCFTPFFIGIFMIVFFNIESKLISFLKILLISFYIN